MTLMTLAYALCSVAVAPVRAHASHKAEMTTQLLFGEKLIIKEKQENSDWIRVMCEWDQYEGWVKEGQVQIIDKKLYRKEIKNLSASTQDVLIIEGHKSLLPLGASLTHLKGKSFDWLPSATTVYAGKKLRLHEVQINGEQIVAAALKYIGAPYLWGGRTSFGIDCSGLSQMAYRLNDFPIYRDASQQIEMGETVDFLFNALPGDLAFFDNEDGAITHVGILMSNDSIIHATDTSGAVVIDTIDNGGIISKIHKKRTHQLRMIKRLIL